MLSKETILKNKLNLLSNYLKKNNDNDIALFFDIIKKFLYKKNEGLSIRLQVYTNVDKDNKIILFTSYIDNPVLKIGETNNIPSLYLYDNKNFITCINLSLCKNIVVDKADVGMYNSYSRVKFLYCDNNEFVIDFKSI